MYKYYIDISWPVSMLNHLVVLFGRIIKIELCL